MVLKLLFVKLNPQLGYTSVGYPIDSLTHLPNGLYILSPDDEAMSNAIVDLLKRETLDVLDWDL